MTRRTQTIETPTTQQPTAPRYAARRPFTYAGVDLARGQVFSMTGAVNDEKLIRLRYVTEIDPSATLYTCAECGVEFVDVQGRGVHAHTAHPERSK